MWYENRLLLLFWLLAALALITWRRRPPAGWEKYAEVAHVISDTNIGGAGQPAGPGGETYGWEPLLSAGGPLADAIRQSSSAEVIILPEGERSLSRALLRSLQRTLVSVDIVHTHASLAGRLIARQRGYKTVLTRHTLGPPLPANGLPGWKRVAYSLVARQLTNAIIAVSAACVGRLQAEGVPENMIRLVYNGIDPRPFLVADRQEARHQLDVLAARPVIATVARLTEVKGLPYALQAAAELWRRGYEFTWLFAGQGPLENELRQQAVQLGLADAVRFLGYREDIPTILAAADIFVLPSIMEALGLSVLEAMASGLPVVASRVGGIPELIRDGQDGTLVTPAAPQELAKAIAFYLRQPAQAEAAGRQGRARVLERFTLEQMCRQTDAVYREVLAGGR